MNYKILINQFDTDSSLMTAVDEAFGKNLSEDEINQIRCNLPYVIWTGDDLNLGKSYIKTLNIWRTQAELVDQNGYIVKFSVYNSTSGIGKLLKILSIILLIISLIGTISIFKAQPITGILALIFSLLFSSLVFGIGEIICLLKNISNKL